MSPSAVQASSRRPVSSADENTSWREAPGWPDVDVVMPVRDEAATLEDAVTSVRAQVYPGVMHLILGVGPSSDETEALAAELERDSVLTVLPNPEGTTSCGLNRAIRSGRSPVVVRVDAHSELAPGYIRQAVDVLRRTGAGNAGGRQVPSPGTPFESAVAAATSSWLGTGGAAYRTGSTAGPVDTVYLGVFDRAAIEGIGLFDERLIRNQDYELNIRLREAGHTVWFDPDLEVRYRPRGSIRALARQYFEYGVWKAEVLRQHPRSLRLRQLLPPVAVTASAVCLVVSVRKPVAALVPIGYLGLVAVGASRAPRAASFFPVGVVAIVIHWSWAAGLFSGIAGSLRRIR